MLETFKSNQLKGIAITLVMIGHLISADRLHLPPQFRFFATFSVSIFLLLSGYGLTKSYLMNGMKDFIKKRTLAVWIPFTIANIILFIAGGYRHHSLAELIRTITFNNFSLSIDGTMWYIYYITLCYSVFFIVFSLKIKDSLKLATITLLSIVLYIYPPSATYSTLNFQFQIHTFSFPIGIAIAFYMKNKKIANTAISIACFILFVLCFLHLTDNFSIFLYSVCSILFALFAVFSISSFNFKSSILSFFGKYSYEAYLLEGVLMWKKFSHNQIINLMLFFTVTFLSALILSRINNKLRDFLSKKTKAR